MCSTAGSASARARPSTPGSASTSVGLPACTADSVRNLTDVNDDYARSLESLRNRLQDHFARPTLAINGAIYQTDVEDMQFFNFLAGPFGLLRVVTNLDEVSIHGAEPDFNWRANDYFSLFGGIGFTDGEIDRYEGRPYTAGNKCRTLPEYTGNAGAELTIPMGGSGLEFVTRVDGSFVGETWFHPVQHETVPNLPTAFGFGQGNYGKQKPRSL